MQYNKDFLLKLDKQRNKTIYARITALTFEELPVEYIEGRVTQGSINLDGASAVRRTCSLTMVAQDFDYSDYSWGLNTKFKLEIGVENTIDNSYPNIIWFKQGIYLITSFNTSRSSNNFSISISGKDKMALLNGEISGSIEASTDFGTIEEEDLNGNWTIRKIPIPEIIRNAVHHYAGEPYHNIIINDLDTYGLELLEYRYDVPMYLYKAVDSNVYSNATLDGTIEIDYNEKTMQLKDLNNDNFVFDNLTDTLISNFYMLIDHSSEVIVGRDGKIIVLNDVIVGPTQFSFKDDPKEEKTMYILAKIEYGQTAGYRKTDLVYAGDLIANVGESIMSVLDKIKNMLVEFEYFYDLDGRFVFQKKKSYVETMWANENEQSQYYQESLANATNHAYMFNDCELITAFNNNPNLLNLKNDYTIWGERIAASGATVPVHMRYAIDIKPTHYNKISVEENNVEVVDYNNKYNTRLAGQESQEYTIYNYDWREIIYQMALDYFKYAHVLSDFELRVAQANSDYYPSGRTGYEQYYTDLQGFWRQLYNPFITSNKEDLKDQIENIKFWISCYEKQPAEVSKMPIEIEKVENTNEDAWNIIFANRCDGCWFAPREELQENEIGCQYKDNNNCSNYNKSFIYPLIIISNDVTTLNNHIQHDKNKMEENATVITWSDQTKDLTEALIDKYYLKELKEEQLINISINPEQAVVMLNTLFNQENSKKLSLQSLLAKLEADYLVLDNFYEQGKINQFWCKDIYEKPENLNFWFDFLDTNGQLSKFNVKNIGSRTKPINDTAIKSIYFRRVPSVIFVEDIEDEKIDSGYKYIQIGSNNEAMFTISGQGKSAKDKLDELLYQHSYCIESSTITTIPIYYLEPNTRVYLHDEETKLDGDYIVSKITIPLTYNGTMSLTATKAAENII